MKNNVKKKNENEINDNCRRKDGLDKDCDEINEKN